PSHFPPLGTIPPSRKSPVKPSPSFVSQSPTKHTVVQVVSSAVNSHPPSNSASAASLLSSYFNPPINLSNFNSRSVNSSNATNCPKKSQEWTLVKGKSTSSPKKTSNDSSDTTLQHPPPAITTLLSPNSTSTTTPYPPDPPIACPQPSSMLVDNPPLPSLLEEKTLNICDSEMDDAPGPLPPDFILALPAPHTSRPIIPTLPSSTSKLVTPVTSTSFNPFIPTST
ncbi:hypothetical protein HID58_077438, partial [Brassica napus]